jgi:hypothetical protein
MARRRLVRSLQDDFGLMLRNATRHRRARDEPLAWPRKRPNCGRAQRGAVPAVVAHRVSHVIHVVCRRRWPATMRLITMRRLTYFVDKTQGRVGRYIKITIIRRQATLRAQ